MCVIFSHLFLNCDGGVNKICSGLSSRDDFDAGADNETFRALMTIETDILTSAVLVNFLVDLFFFLILKIKKIKDITNILALYCWIIFPQSYLRMSNKRTELNIST